MLQDKMMKNNTQIFLTILLLLHFFNHFAIASEISHVKDVFPKVEQLRGGASSWIISGVTEEQREECTMYENTYTYYSTRGETIMDIKRNNSYMVSVRIYSCGNFMSAFNLYEELSQVEKDYEGSKQTAPAPFGEMGSFFAIPTEKGADYMADFYLTYIMRTFVVQVYSDDGFAQMDTAGVVEQGLYQLVQQYGNSYYINKINLEANYNGEKYNTPITFTGDNITTVMLDGIVYDKENKPMPNITLTVKETGQTTKTDSEGYYNLEVTAGNKDAISLTKVVFLPVNTDDSTKPIRTGVYEVATNKSPYVINVIETNDTLVGKMYDSARKLTYDFTGTVKDNNAIRLVANCAKPGSTLKCAIIFSGNVDDNGTISGQYRGSDKGEWSIDKTKYVPMKEQKYLQDTNLFITGSVFEGGRFTTVNSSSFKLESGENNSFIRVLTNADKADLFYFKSAKLLFDVLSVVGEGKVSLYEIVESADGAIALKKVRDIASISSNDVRKTFKVDVTAEYRLPTKYGYLIAVEGAEVVLKPKTVPVELEYYRDAKNYTPKELMTGKLVTFKGADLASNTNAVKGDKAEDVELSISVAAKGRTLEYVEVATLEAPLMRWNTNRFDIYPLVVVSHDGKIINDQNGDIKTKLAKDVDEFTLSLYKGALNELEVKQFLVKIILDGKVYETIVDVSKK